MWERLRKAAKATTPTNAELRATHKASLARRQAMGNALLVGSLGTGATGLLGIMGVAASNQALALGTNATLAAAGQALAGLGTMAVGTATLPVASVIVLGVAAAGVTAFLATQIAGRMGAFSQNLKEREDLEWRAAVNPEGQAKNAKVSWVSALKSLVAENVVQVVSASKERFQEETKGIETVPLRVEPYVPVQDQLMLAIQTNDLPTIDALFDQVPNVTTARSGFGFSMLTYAIQAGNETLVTRLLDAGADIDEPWCKGSLLKARDYAKSVDESFPHLKEVIANHDQKKMAVQETVHDERNVAPVIATPMDSANAYEDIVNQYQQLRADEGVVGLLREPNPVSGSYTGKVLAVNDRYVVQNIGQGQAVVHDRAKLEGITVGVGQKLDVRYKDAKVVDRTARPEASRETGISR